MHEKVDAWKNGSMEKWMHERMDAWKNGWMDGNNYACMVEYMNRMDEYTNE